MGSERSPKEKKRSRRRSIDSVSSDDEERGKRRRGTEKDEEKRSRRTDKEKKKHRSDKEKKSKDKHKKKHQKGDGHTKHGITELSSEDYFAKNNEFAAWLKEEKGTYFADLTSESARELFVGFVKAWNKGKLESRYYEGIANGPRTAHNWKIKR